MAKDSAAGIELGRSFHQEGTVHVKVCESDFVKFREMAWRRWDGIGSSRQVVGWLERMSLETSASETKEKDVNECMFAGKMCLTDCGVENCAVMVLILLNNLEHFTWFKCRCI